MIHRFETIDSTNTYAKQLAQQGAENATFVVARHQTGGRGRMGRTFHSPAGQGLYLSMILRPGCSADQLMHLTCAAGVAACDAIEKTTAFRPSIKWTNDIVCGKRKLGGILTELGFNGSDLEYAIIGIGINCFQSAEDFPEELQQIAASLSMICKERPNIDALEANLIHALTEISERLLSEKASIMNRYRIDCITPGNDISILQNDTVTHGKALDIDDDGGLIVSLADGTVKTVGFGEVSIRGMYGYL